MNQLFIGLIAGVFGMACFVHGKRQAKFAPTMRGVALCVYPRLTDSLPWLCVIGAALPAIAFVANP